METYTKTFTTLSQLFYNKSPADLDLVQRFAIQTHIESIPPEITAEEYYDTLDNVPRRAELVLKRIRKSKAKDYLFVTINPKDTLTPAKFHNMIKQIVEYTTVDDYLYCFETRGENPQSLHHGMHAHILLHVTTRQDKVREQIIRKFTCVVGNLQHIDIRRCTLIDAIRIRKYIEGYKNGALKKNHHFDIEFRKLNSLQPMYSPV